MSNDSITDQSLIPVANTIVGRRDELLIERRNLIARRAEILNALRRIDRELADCRATARFFKLDIPFPAEDSDEAAHVERIERERYEHERAVRMAAIRRREAMPSSFHLPTLPVPPPPPPLQAPPPKQTVEKTQSEPNPSADKDAPTLRAAVLERLASAGNEGTKASSIREFYERSYGKVIHEKTVGMTLYRLQKEGLVRRNGHIWFPTTTKTEAGNPGVSAPGPINPST